MNKVVKPLTVEELDKLSEMSFTPELIDKLTPKSARRILEKGWHQSVVKIHPDGNITNIWEESMPLSEEIKRVKLKHLKEDEPPIRRVNKIPDWIRWILFIPLALLAFVIVYPLWMFVVDLFGLESVLFEGWQRVGIRIMGSGISSAGFVWIGATIAPKRQSLISKILAGLLVLIYGAIIITGVYLLIKKEYPELTIGMISTLIFYFAGIFGAIVAAYSFSNKKRDIGLN